MVSGPANGSLVLNSDGSFTYTPAANSHGRIDSFTYSVADEALTSNVATVKITVNAVNDVPVATPDAATVIEDQPFSGSVSTQASDVDGDALTFSLVEDVAHGTLILNGDGWPYTYTPSPILPRYRPLRLQAP